MQHTSPWIFSFGHGQADGGNEVKPLVGGKGASLAEMTRAGLNVPPGFTVSTEACRLYYQNQQTWPDGLLDQIRTALERLEKISGRTLGRGERPLLVAVRSGAAQSMPGMMDTLLNVGLNPDCIRAMGEQMADTRKAWEDYLNFLLMYGKTVYVPQNIIDEAKLDEQVSRFLIEQKATDVADLDAARVESLCEKVIDAFHQSGVDFPTDPWDMLKGAVLAVFRSWNSERALTYRKHHKIDGVMGTAVNVQMMCPSEISGVLFTTNPVQAGLDEIIIESSYGLGEAVVLGKVTPDRFVLNKKTLAFQERHAAPKQANVQRLNGDAFSLNDDQVQDLARLGLKVEDYFQGPCDIEWGLADGRFYLLQSRRIRHKGPSVNPVELEQVRQEEIALLKAMADPRGTVWARFNLSEILPEPTPMTWAVVRQFISGKGGSGLMYRDLGFDPDPGLDEVGTFDLICGRPYCNLSREPNMQYRNMPFEHSFTRLKADPSQALYPRATPNFAHAGWKFWLTLPATFVKMKLASWKQRRLEKTFAARFVNEIVPRYLEEVKQAEREELSSLSPGALLQRFESWIKKTLYDFARESLKPTALAGIAMAKLEGTLTERLKPFSRDPQKDKENLTKATQRAQAFVRELVMGVHPDADSDLPGALRDLSAGTLSKEVFLENFGHRGSMEMELAKPRWRDDNDSLPQTRGARRASEGEPGTDKIPSNDPPPQPQNLTADSVWDRLAMEAHLLPFQRDILEREVTTLRKYLQLRETGKHQLMRGYALLRRYLVELDRRYNLDGGIFYLTPEELPPLVSTLPDDAANLKEVAELTKTRRKRRDIALSLPAPQVIFSDNLDAIGKLEDIQGADVLQGVPLSAGIAEGSAWVLHQAEESTPPTDDYILVCPSTDPAWVPLFVKARGLVMETGGVLSHGAIVAREFGLPAVAGISEVHRRLKTGQRLRVDGSTGKVSVLS